MEKGSSLKLIMEKGPREGETLEFTSRSVVRIGRIVRGNTIAIKDDGVSSKHLSIQFDSESGKWILSDLESSNGTFLNDTKLTPNIPSHLTDNDCIKIGEYTSIIVRIEIEATISTLPRRGRGKCGVSNKVVVAVSVNSENREVSLRRTRSSKREETVVNNFNSILPQIIDESDGREVENLVPVEGKKTRGRKKKLQDEPSENVEPSVVEEKLGLGGDNHFNSILPQIPDESDGREVESLVAIQGKNTRGGVRGRRKKLQDESSEKVEPSVVEEKLGLGGDMVLEKKSVINEILPNRSSEEAEDLNLGQEGCEGSVKDNAIDVNVSENIDLEKMTLGEWFDYLEVHLTKEIYDTTEAMILDMKQQAQKFHEFRLLQKNAKDKGKQPME